MSEWKTYIADSTESGTVIRGYSLEDLVGTITYTQGIFLLLAGRLPNKKETQMLDAMFVSAMEHGIAVPSITSARIVLSGGNPLHVGAAAGILSLGESHGGAIEAAALVLSSKKSSKAIVIDHKKRKVRVAGFGHRMYKDQDPRAELLFSYAKKLGFYKSHCKLAKAIESELSDSKKKIPLNIDGAMAAILLDMGLDAKMSRAFFIIPRTAGILAHLYEEMTQEKPLRRLNDYKYLGQRGKKR
jgi:citryl-CoA lyase